MIHTTLTARRAALAGFAITLALAVRALAADPPPPPTATPATPAAPAAPVATPPAKDTTAGPAPAAKPGETSKGTPQHFEPTEKTRADFEVSFPVDI
jgi:hypothetical protein